MMRETRGEGSSTQWTPEVICLMRSLRVLLPSSNQFMSWPCRVFSESQWPYWTFLRMGTQ